MTCLFRWRAPLALCPAALVPLLALSGCGPSFQALHEGNARFEHCYALEEDSQVSMREKATCWRDWSEHYTYAQTRDRIHYATARYVALSQAPSVPTDEAMMMAAPGETPRISSITAPAPTNAFAPPPKVLDVGEQRVTTSGHPGEAAAMAMPGIDGGVPAPVPMSLPAANCADGCGTTYRGCRGGCEASDAGAPAQSKGKPCETCLQTYRTCMRDCFR